MNSHRLTSSTQDTDDIFKHLKLQHSLHTTPTTLHHHCAMKTFTTIASLLLVATAVVAAPVEKQDACPDILTKMKPLLSKSARADTLLNHTQTQRHIH